MTNDEFLYAINNWCANKGYSFLVVVKMYSVYIKDTEYWQNQPLTNLYWSN